MPDFPVCCGLSAKINYVSFVRILIVGVFSTHTPDCLSYAFDFIVLRSPLSFSTVLKELRNAEMDENRYAVRPRRCVRIRTSPQSHRGADPRDVTLMLREAYYEMPSVLSPLQSSWCVCVCCVRKTVKVAACLSRGSQSTQTRGGECPSNEIARK